VFPIFNTDLNFSSTRPDKYPSTDRWLYGGQLGIDWKINKDFSFKVAGAFYDFDDVAGRQSNQTNTFSSGDLGNTDDTRPSFAQFGNTYRLLRQYQDFLGNVNPQYYGLATSFRNVDVAGKLEYKRFEPFLISLYGEFAKNIAFNAAHINRIAINNRGPDISVNPPVAGPFLGGDTAWIVGFKLGAAALQKRWDWNLSLDYRYVESDAVVDGFCDSDFGGGGTNVKGYTLSAALALAPRISVAFRWMSSDQVAGPTLKEDVLQVDVNAKW
jgi:hypothetical protein